MRWPLIVIALAACACPNKQTTTTTTGGTGSGGGPTTGTPCERVTAKVRELYRADAQSDEAIADNTAMVIAECNRAPDPVSACIAGVTTVNALEATCLPKLDEEGSEADVLVR